MQAPLHYSVGNGAAAGGSPEADSTPEGAVVSETQHAIEQQLEASPSVPAAVPSAAPQATRVEAAVSKPTVVRPPVAAAAPAPTSGPTAEVESDKALKVKLVRSSLATAVLPSP